MLKKFLGDPSLIVPTKIVGNTDNLSFEDVRVQILNPQVCKLRTKEVATIKVLRRNQLFKK